MATSKWRDVKAARDMAMTDEERAVYREAYERAGVALRLAELFYDTRSQTGLSQTELARRMGTTQAAIARIEGGSTPTVDMLDRLARAMGKRLEISLADAN